MLVSLGMDVPSMVEDILSDEYEEGEILDDDILYENVSSLEEFSDVDDRKSKGVRLAAKKIKSKRKKEHKCKEDSLCRAERSGKHCYARIRRKNSLESKPRNVCSDSDVDDKKRSAKSTSPHGEFKRDAFNKDPTKVKGKFDVRKRGLPYYFQHDTRLQPPKKVVPDRRGKNNRRSAEDHRGFRKRKSRSPSPWKPEKRLPPPVQVTKSSLLERLVGSGVIPVKTHDDVKPVASEDQTVPEDPSPDFDPGVAGKSELCPADIPVHPAPKAPSPEPPKEEIEELHLRLNALKTAIMKKHTDLKRKKRLAASKKRDSVEDSFTEFAMRGLIEDECESIPTPPPPGTDWPAAPLDDNRWSDEDMVIDQESVCGDVVIESNIPASDPSLQSFDYAAVSSPSSQDKLPCCKGNPIPVISPHRPAKEAGPVKSITSVIPVVCSDVKTERTPSGSRLAPKYLKEINSNKLMRRRRRSVRNPRKRRASMNIKQGLKRSVKERPKPVEGDDDEDELRKLALMSVKPKPVISEGMLTSVGTDLNPLTIETDPNAPEKIPAKNQSLAEPWDDLDEDILRAQLLSSLSRSIPDETVTAPKQNSPDLKKQILTSRINKENLYRKNAQAQGKPLKKNPAKFINPNAKPSLTPPLNPSKVEKFIIKVSDSETSEDEESKLAISQVQSHVNASTRKSAIELSIDRLLEETRKETELIQKASEFYPAFSVPEPEKVPNEESVATLSTESAATLSAESAPSSLDEKIDGNLPSSSAMQPKVINSDATRSHGLSHLSVWQQEEFVRQKRVMAHKGSLIEAAKRRIREKNEQTSAGDVAGMAVVPETEVGCPGDTVPRQDGDECVPVAESTDVSGCEVQAVLEEILSRVSGVPETTDSGSAVTFSVALQSGVVVNETARTLTPDKNRKVCVIEPVKSPKPKVLSGMQRKIPIPNSVVVLEKASLQKSPLRKLPPAALKKAVANPLNKPASSRVDPAAQKPFVFKDSSYAAKALNEMVDMVTGFEAGMAEYKNLKKDYIALRKQLGLAHQEMTKKRQELMEMKGSVLNKRRFLESTLTMDTSSLSPLPDIREQPKQSSRDSELFSLRFKEVCLRAQFAMMGLETGVRPAVKPAIKPPVKPPVRPVPVVKSSRPWENLATSPRKRLKPKPRAVERLRPMAEKKLVKPVPESVPKPQELPGTSKKLVVSVLDKDRMDPLIPLCPYDITGVCKDEECKYQHLRTE